MEPNTIRFSLKNKTGLIKYSNESQSENRACVRKNGVDNVITTGETIVLKTKTNIFDSFNDFVDDYERQIDDCILRHVDANTIYSLSERLVTECFNLFTHIVEHHSSDKELINESLIYFRNKFKSSETRYKRTKKKHAEPSYVEPVEKAIGLKWKANNQNPVPHHILVQEKFSYVSIITTIKKQFADPFFAKTYFDHNAKRVAVDGVFTDYSTGSNFKNSALFSSDPDAIQIQLGIDDCQFACATKTRATQKLTCIYMQIKNLPQQYMSRLDTIYLVAICHAGNLKQEYTSLDDILELIVSEIAVKMMVFLLKPVSI